MAFSPSSLFRFLIWHLTELGEEIVHGVPNQHTEQV